MKLSRLMNRAWTLVVLSAIACKYEASVVPPQRVLSTIDVTLANPTMEVGQFSQANANAFDQNGATFSSGPVTWSSSVPTVAGVSPTTGAILAIAQGTSEISATIAGVVGKRTLRVSRAADIRVNEVQTDGNARSGFLEFFNPTPNLVDLSGWTLVGTDFFGPTFTFPSGTTLAAGAFRVVSESNLPFDLNAIGEAHLFSRFGVLVDGATWAVLPPQGAGRCPDGSGPFIGLSTITRGAANLCQ